MGTNLAIYVFAFSGDILNNEYSNLKVLHLSNDGDIWVSRA